MPERHASQTGVSPRTEMVSIPLRMQGRRRRGHRPQTAHSLTGFDTDEPSRWDVGGVSITPRGFSATDSEAPLWPRGARDFGPSACGCGRWSSLAATSDTFATAFASGAHALASARPDCRRDAGVSGPQGRVLINKQI